MKPELRRRLLGVRAAIRAHARAIWSRDRSHLPTGAALGNRTLRILIASLRGLSVHRVGLQAAALTYYTVFSIVPLLVVVVWILKLLDRIPELDAGLPGAAAHLPNGNSLLTTALHRLLENVSHTAQVTGGIVGLVTFLYAVVRLLIYTERALDTISSSSRRRPKLLRLLGYLALLLLPPLLAVVAGGTAAAARTALGSKVWGLVHAFPRFKLAGLSILGLLLLSVAIAIFYAAAPRARIAFRSAMLGGFAAALLLSIVLWAFAAFQIGMSRSNSVQFGATAGPVLLLWVFASWYVVLLGAEIAVAHSVDRILVFGLWTVRLDGLGEQETAVAIMVRAAHAANGIVAVDALARELRLPPQLVRHLCLRLLARGLLRGSGLGAFALACDPGRTSAADVVDAVVRDPRLHPTRANAAGARATGAVAAPVASAGPPPSGDFGSTLLELAAARMV